MDSRIECAIFIFLPIMLILHLNLPYSPLKHLGLNLGEAHIIRNAGGIA